MKGWGRSMRWALILGIGVFILSLCNPKPILADKGGSGGGNYWISGKVTHISASLFNPWPVEVVLEHVGYPPFTDVTYVNSFGEFKFSRRALVPEGTYKIYVRMHGSRKCSEITFTARSTGKYYFILNCSPILKVYF
jgi:hypothetical protein